MQKRTLSFGRHLYEVASNFLSSFLSLSAALILLLASPAAVSANFIIDTSSTSMTGLWGNQNESGWGTAITHEYEMIFVTIYTYDASGNPVWYVASSCPVAADKCAGTLYSVKGGTSLTEPWNGTHKVVAEAGTLNLVFTDANTGTMTYTINGVSGSKAITRQVFANGATQPAADYSGLWGNASESGWGVALTRQFDMTFVTIYTYDANGNPKWYVASSCPMVADGCSGPLYSVTGGSPLTTAWNGANKVVTSIGNMNLAFTDPNTGTMTFTINGMSNSKAITRQIFANPPVKPSVSGGSTPTPTPTPGTSTTNQFTNSSWSGTATVTNSNTDSGCTSSTWTATIDSAGLLTGNTSSNCGDVSTLVGTVDSSGTTSFGYAGGNVCTFSGQFSVSPTSSASGTFTCSDAGASASGTWTGSGSGSGGSSSAGGSTPGGQTAGTVSCQLSGSNAYITLCNTYGSHIKTSCSAGETTVASCSGTNTCTSTGSDSSWVVTNYFGGSMFSSVASMYQSNCTAATGTWH